MAFVTKPTADMLAVWEHWVAERPPAVRAVAERLVPWKLYRLRNPEGVDQRVTVLSYGETNDPELPVTLTVVVSADFNRILFSRQVFGIDPDRLTECDLPDDDEMVGCPEIDIERARHLHSLPDVERQAELAKDMHNALLEGKFRRFAEVREERGI